MIKPATMTSSDLHEQETKLVQLLHEYRARDQIKAGREARWYIVAVSTKFATLITFLTGHRLWLWLLAVQVIACLSCTKKLCNLLI